VKGIVQPRILQAGEPSPPVATTRARGGRRIVGAVMSGVLVFAAAFQVWAAPGIGYPLAFDFARGHFPAAGSAATLVGTVGGLPSWLSLGAAPGQCAPDGACGTFVVAVSGIPSKVSRRFGQLQGPFACQSGGCAFTITDVSGVFSRVRVGIPLFIRPEQPIAEFLGTSLTSRGDWVSTVARTAAAMKAEGVLPASMSVEDLVVQAASNAAGTGGIHWPAGPATSGPGGATVPPAAIGISGRGTAGTGGASHSGDTDGHGITGVTPTESTPGVP
jgi:hypothetical protein